MKRFNVTGVCVPGKHYMVDISDKLEQIKKMVDYGEYFTINRARQYGKTTTLSLLKKALDDEYIYELIYEILMLGKKRTYAVGNPTVDIARIYGIIEETDLGVAVANRIFDVVVSH